MMARTVGFVLFLFGMGCCVGHVAGCTPDARRALLETTLDAATCAVKHLDLPDAEILKVCAIEAADADRILRIIGEARQQTARAAAKASAGRCGDAGAP